MSLMDPHFVVYFLTPHVASMLPSAFMCGTVSRLHVLTPNSALPSVANLLVPHALSMPAIAIIMLMGTLLSLSVVQFRYETHMKALGNPDANWGVKKYKTKCESIKDMIRILNTHPAYEKFRVEREQQLETGTWNYRKLLSGMTAWSTNPDYQEIILQTIVDNKLP